MPASRFALPPAPIIRGMEGIPRLPPQPVPPWRGLFHYARSPVGTCRPRIGRGSLKDAVPRFPDLITRQGTHRAHPPLPRPMRAPKEKPRP